MTIKNSLPKFKKKTLIIVASKQTAQFYLAYKDKINEIDYLKIETPVYSDREGFFERSGKGMLYGSGSVYESKDIETRNKFARALANSIKEKIEKQEIASIYLFSPEYMKNEINSHISPEIKKKLICELYGNYSKISPFKLLKMIKGKQNKLKEFKMIRPIKEEAKKILNKTGKIKPYIL